MDLFLCTVIKAVFLNSFNEEFNLWVKCTYDIHKNRATKIINDSKVFTSQVFLTCSISLKHWSSDKYHSTYNKGCTLVYIKSIIILRPLVPLHL